jgi:hypothetical protein
MHQYDELDTPSIRFALMNVSLPNIGLDGAASLPPNTASRDPAVTCSTSFEKLQMFETR